jgi:hypothetical protein
MAIEWGMTIAFDHFSACARDTTNAFPNTARRHGAESGNGQAFDKQERFFDP